MITRSEMTNTYPQAKLVPAHKTNYLCWLPKRNFSLVVCHVTSGHADPMGTAEMFASKIDHGPVSAHFVVGQRVESEEPVIQCVDLNDIAFHASEVNRISVGIEFCGREPGEFSKVDPGLAITEFQYQKGARLYAFLARLGGFPIDRDHFKGHAEASPRDGHDKCPTGVLGGWNWDHFLDLASKAYAVCS